jgi:hypothetical protein
MYVLISTLKSAELDKPISLQRQVSQGRVMNVAAVRERERERENLIAAVILVSGLGNFR